MSYSVLEYRHKVLVNNIEARLCREFAVELIELEIMPLTMFSHT